ncbi:hypothetical protein B0H67DRAFT_601788 [Lasiosphaeris hirsuta]|uniref:Uncharacterized protein n=1 Tax=Lasiosphaeris hirsuta TaxID=260670 RepID=A0AA40A7V3_9PEZI|nr:hypothetical protein B0H67DRAFT_601788 [Lasiosphaeris hirsuta]
MLARTWVPPEKPGAGGHRGRYLWTDAFGIINFITLSKETSSPIYLILAKRLVSAVHDVLGRTRDGPARLPRATDDKPLKGGLRIGNMDAQGGDCVYNQFGVQLARAVHPHFVKHREGGDGLRMVWKISTNMKTVLVPSEGYLDAATGFGIYRLLERAAELLYGPPSGVLIDEISKYRQLMSHEGKLKANYDPLDLGMGLWVCHFFRDEDWARTLGSQSLEIAPIISVSRRLAFREFGTCLGLGCYGVDGDLKEGLTVVIDFWQKLVDDLSDENLRPITLVMYAAALVPRGKLDADREAMGRVTRLSFPAIFARGGTSNGLVIFRHHLPPMDLWHTVLPAAMGSPDPSGRQLNGLVTSSTIEPDPSHDFQTALVRVFNTNTRKVMHSRFRVAGDPPRYCPDGDYEMDGVPGRQSKIVMSFLDPGGAKTGRVFPTGSPVDTLTLPDGSTVQASLVDVSNPGVFVRASDLGIGDLSFLAPPAVEADPALKIRLEQIRQAGAATMGLDPGVESVPKVVMVFPPPHARLSPGIDIKCLAMSMGQTHKAVPLTLALCLGAAARTEGTIPHELAAGHEKGGVIVIGHPSGRLEVGTTVRDGHIVSAELHRTARVLMKGEIFYE